MGGPFGVDLICRGVCGLSASPKPDYTEEPPESPTGDPTASFPGHPSASSWAPLKRGQELGG